MKRLIKKAICVLIILGGVLVFSVGCQEAEIMHLLSEVNTVQGQVSEIAQAVGQAEYDDDEMLNLLRAAQAGNAASAPFNPYALPIGAGLSGVIALLEALRRVEKGKRKYAEHELRNGNNRSNNG